MQQFIDKYDFKGKKAIVRVDFNVPLNENFEITDDTRIVRAMPTLKKVLAEGGSLNIMSHLGRPKKVDPKFSLKHTVGRVSECLGVPVQFAEDCQTADAQAAALKPGEALLLENLRFYAEEEGKPRGLAEDASEEEKKAMEEKAAESKDLLEKLKADLDGKVKEVKLSDRLTKSVACLNGEGGVSIEMYKTLKAMPNAGDIPMDFVLELNPNHPVFAKLSTLSDEDRKQYAELLYQQARLMAGLPLDDPAAFSELVCKLM